MLFLAGLFLGCLIGLLVASLCVAVREKGGVSCANIPRINGEILEKAAYQR